MSGIAQRLGSPEATLDWKHNGTKASRPLPGAGHDEALRAVVALLHELGLTDELIGVGHRVVHGGSKFSGLDGHHARSHREDRGVHPARAAAQSAEPGRHPHRAGAVSRHCCRSASSTRRSTRRCRAVAYTYPVPHEWLETHGVRRYGFHGTSHRFVAQQALAQTGLPRRRPRHRHGAPGQRLLVHGRPQRQERRHDDGADAARGRDDGHAQRVGGPGDRRPRRAARSTSTAQQVLDALNKKSGLLGVSGLSNDMRTIEEPAAERTRSRARWRSTSSATCWPSRSRASSCRSAGSTRSSFTGGIGENSVDGAREDRRAPRVPRPDARPGRQRGARARPARPDHGGDAAAGAGRAHQRRTHDCDGHRGDRRSAVADGLPSPRVAFGRNRCLPPFSLHRPAGASA